MTKDIRPGGYGEPEYKRSNAVPTSEEEIDNLARLIYAEGDGVTKKVKAMLGSTVRNRVREQSRQLEIVFSTILYCIGMAAKICNTKRHGVVSCL